MNNPIKLIVGLGNPGTEYANTRHNAGAAFVTELAAQHSVSLAPESRFFGLSAHIFFGADDVRLLIPTTFMNLSGKAVVAMAQLHKIEADNVSVAHEQLNLCPAVARLKLGGVHGTRIH